jgi:hypothetical protein
MMVPRLLILALVVLLPAAAHAQTVRQLGQFKTYQVQRFEMQIGTNPCEVARAAILPQRG